MYVSKDPYIEIYNMTDQPLDIFLLQKYGKNQPNFFASSITAVPEQSLTYNLSSLALGPIKSYWTLISKKIVFLLSRIWMKKKSFIILILGQARLSYHIEL